MNARTNATRRANSYIRFNEAFNKFEGRKNQVEKMGEKKHREKIKRHNEGGGAVVNYVRENQFIIQNRYEQRSRGIQRKRNLLDRRFQLWALVIRTLPALMSGKKVCKSHGEEEGG